jgi:diguanylate cyclase (GGDEF)-like protein
VRGDDMLARFGGDEFCIILNHAANRGKVKMVAERILQSISEPYIRENLTMNIGVSIGIGLFTEDIEDSEALLKQADEAMYLVKQSGKGQFCFFDELTHKKLSEKPKPAEQQEDWQQNSQRPSEIT